MGQVNGPPLKALIPVSALLSVALAAGGNEAQAKRDAVNLALADINVVDLQSGRVLSHRTVVIAGNEIVAVQDASVHLKPGTKIIPSTGKYVMPGLWDMHVHVADDRYVNLFVANGITGVRDMGGGLDKAADGCESIKPSILRRWRSEITVGHRLGPELVISGPAVSGTGWPSSLPARSLVEAKAAVAALWRQRVDFVKVYERIPLSAYNVLASEAHRTRLPFAGHVPEDVGPLKAIRAGQRSIEHVREALLVCFTDRPAELEQFFTEDRWSNDDKQWGRSAHASCPQIVAALRTTEAWLTPTLTVEKAKVSVEDPNHVQDRRRRFLPQSVRHGYSAYVKRKEMQSPTDRASERLWWRAQQRFVKRMREEGVKLLAGTDAACEGGLPGYSLHGELRELVAAGLSPADALKTATVEPARYFSRQDEGQVRQGYRANLLVLDGNPMDRIENTQAIHGVILDGKLLQRPQLDLLLSRRRAPR